MDRIVVAQCPGFFVFISGSAERWMRSMVPPGCCSTTQMTDSSRSWGDVMGNFFGGTYLDNEATEIEENLLFSQNGGGGGGGGGGPTTKYHRKGTEKREKGIQIP